MRRKKRTLQEGIADFYDASTGVWVEIWGDHLHHGYYEDNSWRSLQQHREAQVRMIEEVLSWAEVSSGPEAPKAILDVGCGVGGSSRHLQKKYGAKVTGITLSPKQQQQATSLSVKSGQADSCEFKVADALKMPFPDDSFDLVWSLESGEHMPEKAKFMSEMHRVCKPGGRIILVTWVHRNLTKDEALKPKEQRLLKQISKAYHLPDWCSMDDYCQIAVANLGMTGVASKVERAEIESAAVLPPKELRIRSEDWSQFIAPFWSAVIQTALRPQGWWALARGGLETFRGALVMPLMNRGYRTGTIRFGLMTGCKTPAGGDTAAASTAAATALSARRPGRLALCGALGQVVSSSTRRSSRLVGLLDLAKTVWDFSRPHTLVGTIISITTVHLFAVAPLSAIDWPLFALQTVRALAPAMLVNVYITGLNQIYDVDIDRQNKPYLPIPSGRLSVTAAWLIVLGSLFGAEAVTCTYPTAGVMALQFPLIASAILGTAYSVPPFRLKRFPFLAALCIIVVRGIVVNMGFYYYIVHALGVSGQVSTLRSAMAASFFAIFGLVIALMKDVPDVLGDQKASIRSVSVRLGPARALRIAVSLLKFLLVGTATSFGLASGWAFVSKAPGSALARGVLAVISLLFCRSLQRKERLVDAEKPKQVFDFYMFVWKIFYLCYLLLPLAM
ncbi:VTE4 [Symbiodinium pilosum]|uniref:VTE4 protein n=1 Tax=Symbiodinium pilosum TaxID=2952 RepID=A0A812LGI0_SYMPI|nr:VTE4 [Symbiodinium pilosum]